MSSGIYVNAEIYVSNITKESLDEHIEENENFISMYEKEIMMLAASNPRDGASDESIKEGTIIEDLRIKVDNLLKEYRDCIYAQARFSILNEHRDKIEEDI